MSFLEGTLRFITGGLLILFISYLGKNKIPYIASFAVLFPIITVIGFYFLSLELPTKQLKNAVLHSVFALPTVLVFLLTLFISLNKFNIVKSLGISIAAWFFTALIIVFLISFFEGGNRA